MRSLSRLMWSTALALVSAFGVVELVLGISSGSIDGPARGRDYVIAAEAPRLFWTMATVYLLIAIAAGGAAIALLKSKAGGPPA